jgi:hypothetical protein
MPSHNTTTPTDTITITVCPTVTLAVVWFKWRRFINFMLHDGQAGRTTVPPVLDEGRFMPK